MGILKNTSKPVLQIRKIKVERGIARILNKVTSERHTFKQTWVQVLTPQLTSVSLSFHIGKKKKVNWLIILTSNFVEFVKVYEAYHMGLKTIHCLLHNSLSIKQFRSEKFVFII